MYTAVKGIYEKGRLTFIESPPAVEKSEVVVLFMKEQATVESVNPTGRKAGVVLGSLSGKGYSIPEDFNDPLSDLDEHM
ncbi:hypothetical protein [Dyadobacter sp. Leaf189]|uniref:hypothetical protein n=1 Tax=Dyadobacter sp. Leaf189 TaxID=1736295 RepID=UPI0006F6E5AB|nr:hypothetical protein [Dyadobacter sp. Leaf189]KQS25337.1 hypothetical protein ASG33_21760 [Dyadobacter sp. Leaf189]